MSIVINKVINIEELSKSLSRAYGSFDSILDIGCGIRPFSWVDSKHITCVEPFDPYRNILISTFGNESLVALKGDFLSVTEIVDAQQFDAVTLIDVIEHLPKNDGYEGIRKIIESGVKLFFVFTPDGFMPQHAEEIDAWGLNSGSQQEHLSGWTVEDFDGLGFTDYWIVDSLHVENGKSWNGLLAVYDIREVGTGRGIGFWDPSEFPNSPPENKDSVLVFGRHNRFSGSVVGTHQNRIDVKYYIPSLSFAPKQFRAVYKLAIKTILKIVNFFMNKKV